MRKVIVIFGPTASGKSSVAIELAKQIDGEIISADSMQIYREMDIGTAKTTPSEMCGIKHHLLDIIDYSKVFSVADYKELAILAIKSIIKLGKTPIVCGGTGLYIDAIVKNIKFGEEIGESKIRKVLIEEHLQKGNEWMHDKLSILDPVSAQQIHPNNVIRVIRALEVTITTGVAFSKHKENAIANHPEFDFKLFGLEFPREIIYNRINDRVDLMFASGLVEEAKKLYDKKLFDSKTASQAIGYKELSAYFLGNNSIDEVKEKIKMETRRYAKRQITWFKRYKEASWIDCVEKSPEKVAKIISQILSCVEK